MGTYSIGTLPEITAWDEMQLRDQDIQTTHSLLNKAGSPLMRKALFELTKISEEQLLQYAQSCDLMRLYKVGPMYASVLHACGVRTVRDLRSRNAMNLCEKVTEVCSSRAISKFTPPLVFVVRWVKQANELKLKIT